MWGHVTNTGIFLDLANFTNQDGGLANRTKLTNTAKTINPKLTRQGGFSELYFLRIWPQKWFKKLIHCETPDLL